MADIWFTKRTTVFIEWAYGVLVEQLIPEHFRVVAAIKSLAVYAKIHRSDIWLHKDLFYFCFKLVIRVPHNSQRVKKILNYIFSSKILQIHLVISIDNLMTTKNVHNCYYFVWTVGHTMKI